MSRQVRAWWWLACLACALGLARAEEAPAYRRAATWRESLRLSREVLRSPAAPVAGLERGPWEVSGPFAAKAGEGFATVYAPERNDPAVKWVAHADWADGEHHDLPCGGNCAMYVRRTLTAPANVTVEAGFGSDDGLAVWLNGKQIVKDDVARGLAPDSSQAKLALVKGENRLLLKIWNRGGYCGFWFGFARAAETTSRLAQATDALWARLRTDFPDPAAQVAMDRERRDGIWAADWPAGNLKVLAGRYASACRGGLAEPARALAAKVRTPDDLAAVAALYQQSAARGETRQRVASLNPAALRRAIADLSQTWGARYPQGPAWLARLAALEPKLAEARAAGDDGEALDRLSEPVRQLAALAREALLANPLLDADRLVFVRRRLGSAATREMGGRLGFISLNSHCHVTIARSGWDNEVVLLSNLRGEPRQTTLFRPAGDRIVRDLELSYDGRRLMFSSFDDKRKWGVFEVGVDGQGLKTVSPTDYPDVDWFQACYLPDGRVVMLSTASYQGLPCENGSRPMAQLYLVDPAGAGAAGGAAIRQLTFEQDSDYTPSVANDGRVMFTRWEYSDLPHYFSRRVMAMNPDGTNQLALWGSGSYFPTTILQARAIPGEPNAFCAVIGGHHDVPESGRLLVIDPSYAQRYPFKYTPPTKDWGPAGSFLRIPAQTLPKEQTGCVAELPGWGQDVPGDVCDRMTGNQFERGKPHFFRPWPLSSKYFLVSAKPRPDAPWGVYLADTFDNLTLLAESPDCAMLEPVLVGPRRRPPVIPDRITPGAPTAMVHLADIYRGPGLAGVPRGSVKALRVLAYHFAYVGTGGHASLGVQAGWDLKRVLGTVPVEPDGSAFFEIPANTPVSLQPLDEHGAALQLMRSWLVGMPGERVSCVGCHEDTRTATPHKIMQADLRPMRKLTPSLGAPHPYSFEIDVYPVVQQYCAGCHDGGQAAPPPMRNAREAYNSIHPYVRRPGPESEMQTYPAMEWHVSTSPLFQLLAKGHHGVQLEDEAWLRLATWVDVNCPFPGHWNPKPFGGEPQRDRRLVLAKQFANVDTCPEEEYERVAAALKSAPAPTFVKPAPEAPVAPDNLSAPGFPFSAAQAAELQRAAGTVRKVVELPGGQKLTFVRIPAGSFVMGSLDGSADERPRAVVRVDRAFWMSECEVTNGQYAAFDPEHDTRYIAQHGKDHNTPGYIANHPNQPVARVTWLRAMAFCRWLSQLSGSPANLPTEAQWEWAARAGSASQFCYGDLDTDFGRFANLADRSVRWNAVGFQGGPIIMARKPYAPQLNFPLHEERFEDKWFTVDYVGQCEANAWGLKDIVGNVSEWTRSSYRPYPYRADDGRNSGAADERKVARGGSWASRPKEAGSAFRLAYQAYQSVNDVGFRAILED